MKQQRNKIAIESKRNKKAETHLKGAMAPWDGNKAAARFV
jgi:hypothetical protein